MELDELKRSWEQYDQKLAENLRLNQELLRRSNLDRSRREMNTTLNWVWVNVLCVIPLVLLSLRWTLVYSRDPLLLICGIVFTIFMSLSFLYGLKELALLRKIDYYRAPVMELQKQLLAFGTFYHKVKKFELYTLPVVLVAGLIFVFKVSYKIGYLKVDMLERFPKMVIIDLLILIPLTYLLLIWLYRNFYDKKVKAARQFFAELEEFERE